MVPKARIRLVDVPGGTRKIVLLRVPRSIAAPHMVKETPTPIRAQHTPAVTSFNADGLLITIDQIRDQTAYSYTQFFRDGHAEFVVSADSATVPGTVNLEYVEQKVVDAIAALVPALLQAGAAYPFAIAFALAGARDKKAYIGQRPVYEHYPSLGRDLVCLDDVVLESEVDPIEIDSRFRPVFDSMWQCFGHERSRSYDGNGKRMQYRQ
jgi:glycerol-3-phosphate dehydrogenase